MLPPLHLSKTNELMRGTYVQEAALASVPGVTSAATNPTFEQEDEDEEEEDELLSPAERRAKRLADAAARPPIYNAEAMHEKLEDISWPSEVKAPSCCMINKLSTSDS